NKIPLLVSCSKSLHLFLVQWVTSIGKICLCTSGAGEISRRYDYAVTDKGLGNTYCYIRPDPYRLSSFSNVFSEDDSTQKTLWSISGASVSANTSTPPSTTLLDLLPYSSTFDPASSFECSTSFSSIPLQPIPRDSYVGLSGIVPGSSPIERGFQSGPIERWFVSSPVDRGLYSGLIDKGSDSGRLQRSFSHNGYRFRIKPKKWSLTKVFRRAISSTISRGHRSIVTPIKRVVSIRDSDSVKKNENVNVTMGSTNLERHVSLDENDDDGGESGDFSMGIQNLHWAQGKAGEDRVHIVISEDHGWVFVGIYDGFSGPDAPDYLVNNLFNAVQNELKGLLCTDKLECTVTSITIKENSLRLKGDDQWEMRNGITDRCCTSYDKEHYPLRNGGLDLGSESKRIHMRWKCEWDRKRSELDKKLKEQLEFPEFNRAGAIDHSDVLRALSDALMKLDDAYLETSDQMESNPELALMGSCVLVMLMKGEDVYLMNVGDSRAVLAQDDEFDFQLGKTCHESNRITEQPYQDLDRFDNLTSLQLTMDHNTYVKEEVQRIKNEHPDDPSAVTNERVKGYLKVTRAFGAWFLKQPKWNDALLEMFRIDYVGDSPYINCLPSLYHHKLSERDKFLILSSDGLYQFFTNEEAISKVNSFMSLFPDRDPAQLLIQEVLFRAAKKAGIEFHELLEIPQGERRRYHDDISIVIISLDGTIWRSSL
ncbi:Protein phosphatase 2C family protein, partial [Quillaja saponaria]